MGKTCLFLSGLVVGAAILSFVSDESGLGLLLLFVAATLWVESDETDYEQAEPKDE